MYGVVIFFCQVKEGPCVTYIGPGASGNYVKMVHNGIEYADMQLLVESYQILRDVGGLNHQELHGQCTPFPDSMGAVECLL